MSVPGRKPASRIDPVISRLASVLGRWIAVVKLTSRINLRELSRQASVLGIRRQHSEFLLAVQLQWDHLQLAVVVQLLLWLSILSRSQVTAWSSLSIPIPEAT